MLENCLLVWGNPFPLHIGIGSRILPDNKQKTKEEHQDLVIKCNERNYRKEMERKWTRPQRKGGRKKAREVEKAFGMSSEPRVCPRGGRGLFIMALQTLTRRPPK